MPSGSAQEAPRGVKLTDSSRPYARRASSCRIVLRCDEMVVLPSVSAAAACSLRARQGRLDEVEHIDDAGDVDVFPPPKLRAECPAMTNRMSTRRRQHQACSECLEPGIGASHSCDPDQIR